MAIPDTNNSPVVFVSRQPSWETGIELEQSLISDVQISRSGLEQRQGRTGDSKFQMSYSAHLSAAEKRARTKRMRMEVRAPLQVPIWPMGGKLGEAMDDDDFVPCDRPPIAGFNAPGDWVHIVHPRKGSQFRQIKAVVLESYVFSGFDLEPIADAVRFPAGSRIYPCLLCLRDGGNGEFSQDSECVFIERLTYRVL